MSFWSNYYYIKVIICVVFASYVYISALLEGLKDVWKTVWEILNLSWIVHICLFSFPLFCTFVFIFFLVLLLYLVLYANHLPHRSLSLISLFHYPRFFLLISDCSFLTFSILMSGGTCLYIFFLLPSLSVFFLLFLIVVCYPPLPVCPNHLLLYSHPFICISTFPVSLPFNPSFASTFASLYYS